MWLDVDDLVDIGSLEETIKKCQCVIMYVSKGYFQSPNCQREILATIKNNKPFVVVLETSALHFGASASDFRAECEGCNKPEVRKLAARLFDSDGAPTAAPATDAQPEVAVSTVNSNTPAAESVAVDALVEGPWSWLEGNLFSWATAIFTLSTAAAPAAAPAAPAVAPGVEEPSGPLVRFYREGRRGGHLTATVVHLFERLLVHGVVRVTGGGGGPRLQVGIPHLLDPAPRVALSVLRSDGLIAALRRHRLLRIESGPWALRQPTGRAARVGHVGTISFSEVGGESGTEAPSTAPAGALLLMLQVDTFGTGMVVTVPPQRNRRHALAQAVGPRGLTDARVYNLPSTSTASGAVTTKPAPLGELCPKLGIRIRGEPPWTQSQLDEASGPEGEVFLVAWSPIESQLRAAGFSDPHSQNEGTPWAPRVVTVLLDDGSPEARSFDDIGASAPPLLALPNWNAVFSQIAIPLRAGPHLEVSSLAIIDACADACRGSSTQLAPALHGPGARSSDQAPAAARAAEGTQARPRPTSLPSRGIGGDKATDDHPTPGTDSSASEEGRSLAHAGANRASPADDNEV